MEQPVFHNLSISVQSKSFTIAAVGTSGGTIAALNQFVQAIPEATGTAYILSQGLSDIDASDVQILLSGVTNIPVQLITDGIILEPDHIYIVPHNKIVTAANGKLRLCNKEEVSHPDFPIDSLFRSIAVLYKSFAVGIILSGNGFDGTDGLKVTREYGGITYAEEPQGAEFIGMPLSAINAGAADFTLPAEKIPVHLLKIKASYQAIHANIEDEPLPETDEKAYNQIINILQKRTHHDFSHYKQAPIRRRIARRMVATDRSNHLSDYLDFLAHNQEEQDALFHDVLISVTYFFRDSATFDELTINIFPRLLKAGKQPGMIRLWVAGCSTGEEAYSIAICLHELLKDTPGLKIKIFATDISEPCIIKARIGVYNAQAVKNIPPGRISQYFTKQGNGYQVKKVIRELCVFAVHNLLTDPPFSKIDMVSCRNVLIYMDADFQKKALNTFHYALHPGGVLLLGNAESTSSYPEVFSVLNFRHQLYLAKDTVSHFLEHPTRETAMISTVKVAGRPVAKNESVKIAERTLLSKYSPPAIIVDARMQIIHFHGSLGSILLPPEGKPNFNVLKMVRPELIFELRNTFHIVRKAQSPVRSGPVLFTANGYQHLMSMEIAPIQNEGEIFYLVVFDYEPGIAEPAITDTRGKKTKLTREQLRIRQLENEVMQLRDNIRTITDEQEVYNEELQSANEELLSSSEELQSLNEELATSKEELQTSNEELLSLNQELTDRHDQLFAIRTYAEAIVTSIDEPILILDRYNRIKNANAAFYSFFNTNEDKILERSFFELPHTKWNNPELRQILEGINDSKNFLSNYELTVDIGNEHKILLLSARLLTNEPSSESLLLVVFRDITDLRIAAQLKESEERFRLASELTGLGTWELNLFTDRMINSEKIREIMGINEGECSTERFLRSVHPDDLPIAREAFKNALVSRHLFFEVRIIRKDNSIRWIRVNGNTLLNKQQHPSRLLGTIMDITEQKNYLEALEEREQRFKVVADAAPVLIWLADVDKSFYFFNKGWLNFTGRSVAEEFGNGWMNGIHENDLATFRQKFETEFNAREEILTELRLKRHDGEYRWVSMHCLPRFSPDGGFEGYIGAGVDITDQKDFAETLSTQVRQRTMELKQSHELLKEKNDELERSNNELTSFSFIASHDLQEPLRKIRTFSSRILNQDHDNLSEKSRDYFARMNNAAKSMQQLIDDILDYSKVNFSKTKLELTSLNSILDQVITNLSNVLQEKKAKVEVGKLPTLKIIPVQFIQLFTNLIENSIKYSKQDIKPLIKIDAVLVTPGEGDVPDLPHDQQYWKISVADNGIGFDQAYEHRIFEMFQRLHTKAEYSGTGMGLAICKKIVDNNNGQITASGEPGVGATFTIYLPLELQNTQSYL